MNVILGGGLAGLAAAHRFTAAGRPVTVVEKGAVVGGLARTIKHRGFSFDLGGHRLLTDNPVIRDLVSGLLGDDLLTVHRRSRICLNGRYVDYPLNPVNALFGLGIFTSGAIILDYLKEKILPARSGAELISLEDWVVANFGRRMFELYFRDYSEKVWGRDSSCISMDWVARRIDGLSLWRAVRYALCRVGGHGLKTLSDVFLYPRLGIGQLSDRLEEEISRDNPVMTSTVVEEIFHRGATITGVGLREGGQRSLLRGRRYLSSIPLTVFLARMRPRPPEPVLRAAAAISFRSLVVVALMLRRKKVTDLTWLYLPDKNIPFGRIHEPGNWSPQLAPPGRTHLVAEYFCDRDDRTWGAGDAELGATTVAHLERLGFISAAEVMDCRVIRVPHAYPVFSLHYREHIEVVRGWLGRFDNLALIGRSGGYRYLNMDHAMESGIRAAENILRRPAARVSCPEGMAAIPDRS